MDQPTEAGITIRSPSRGYCLIIAVLLIIPVGLGAACARRWTPTHDEYWHLPLGLYAIKTGDCRPDPINPPLIRMWAALPLWWQGTSPGENVFPAYDAYEVGDAFQRAHPVDHREWFFHGRLMMLPFGLLGGVVVVCWARRWWGDAAGLLAAALWCGSPILLAHSAIVAHDLPAMSITLLTLFVTVCHREKPTPLGPWIIGALMGLAFLTKFSTLPLLGLVPLFWLILPSSVVVPKEQKILMLIATVMTAWLTLHIGYAMDSAHHGRPSDMEIWESIWFPQTFVGGLGALQRIIQVPHPVFLDGEWSLTGFRLYYVMALLYQLPLGLWGCIFTAAVLVWRTRRDVTERRRFAALGVILLAILVPASLSGNQLGLRYVFPAIPLMILFASIAARHWSTARTLRRGAVLLMAGLALSSLRYHPHHLSYFNELAGGPEHGRQHLVDSNLDWGQDLHTLREYLLAHPSPEPLQLAYFGTASPALLGIDYEFPASPQPQPGRYAISANFIAGRPHMLRDLDGRERQLALDELAPFRFFEPKAMMGYSIGYYEITPEDVARYHRARQQAMEQFGGR